MDASPLVACAGSEEEDVSSHGESSMSRSTCRFSGPAAANRSPFADAALALAAADDEDDDKADVLAAVR